MTQIADFEQFIGTLEQAADNHADRSRSGVNNPIVRSSHQGAAIALLNVTILLRHLKLGQDITEQVNELLTQEF